MTTPGFSAARRAALITLAGGAGAATLAGVLTGCTEGKPKPKFDGSDITGTHLGSDLAMVDAAGRMRTLADYRGKVVVVYFGYTHCPDVCPTAMAELARVMTLLKNDAARVQVIMISVDPARDTPAIVDHYAKAFNPTFAGLSGSADQLAKTAKSFKVYYTQEASKTPGQYAMSHSSLFYVFDEKGRARVLMNSTASAGNVAHDIRQLL